MNRIRSFLVGLSIGLVGVGVGLAAPIAGAIDPARYIGLLNENVLNWMSFPSAELGELQLLGPNSFVHAGSNHYLTVVDQTGTARYILTTTSTTP